MLTLQCVGVSEISKTAVCNREYYGITYISACMVDIATKFQRYNYVFDVKQHDWTDLTTGVCPGEWKSKMAVCNRKWLYIKLVYMIKTKFQRRSSTSGFVVNL